MIAGNISAFVLHRKPFRERAQWVSLFTYEWGRVSAIYRPSGKNAPRSLSPFQPYVVNLRGEDELKTLQQIEEVQSPLLLTGMAYYAAFYLNELLYRLLPLQVPQERVFQAYAELLANLVRLPSLEAGLRDFERLLLAELGLGLDVWSEELMACQEGETCAFDVREGRSVVSVDRGTAQDTSYFIGNLDPVLLLAVQRQDWSVDGALGLAKMLHRARIDYVLEGKPLKSRSVLKKYLELARVEKKSSSGR